MKGQILGLMLAGVVILGGLVVRPEVKVVFLDVGQGDAILLQDGGAQVLVDGGPGMDVLSELAREMPYWDRRVEVLVLSHPQKDHMEGLLHVLERYEVGLVLLPEAGAEAQMQERWLELIAERNIPYRFARAGQKVEAGGIKIEILAPLEGDAAAAAIKSDINNASVVMRVEMGGLAGLGFTPSLSPSEMGSNTLSFLLSGDAEKRVEKLLVEKYHQPDSIPGDDAGIAGTGLLDVDVFKAGHHGSKTSSSAELLTAASPQAVVVSVGKENSFGHPAPEVLDRFGEVPVFRTDTDGAVVWQLSGGEWLVKTRDLKANL